jgi:hypothetical protein
MQQSTWISEAGKPLVYSFCPERINKYAENQDVIIFCRCPEYLPDLCYFLSPALI